MYDSDLVEINKILKEYISLRSTLSFKKEITARWKRVTSFEKKLIHIFSGHLLFGLLFVYVFFFKFGVNNYVRRILNVHVKNNTSLQTDFSSIIWR